MSASTLHEALSRFWHAVAPIGIVFCTRGSGGCAREHPPGVSPRPWRSGFTPPGALSLLSEEFYHVCQAHEGEFESLGLSLVAGRAIEPLHGAGGRSVVSLSFLAALAHPFRSEGGVEHVRLPLVGVSSDISGELLSGSPSGGPCPYSIGVGLRSRDTLQKIQRASLVGPRAVRSALGARHLSTVGSHSETSLLVSDMT